MSILYILLVDTYNMSPDIPKTVYNVIKYGIIIGIFISLLILIVGSVLVHDTYYITKHPKFFISETLIMGILTSIPIIFISQLRGAPIAKSMIEFSVFFVKIAIIHIGFQLSGVYSVLFPET